MYYRGCWHMVSRGFLIRYRQLFVISSKYLSSLITEFYIPKNFVIHAALLGQGFPHCRKFPTAASRRSLGRVSVPVWLFCLSAQLNIVALVGHYLYQLANVPQGHPLVFLYRTFKYIKMPSYILSSFSYRFQ